MSGGVNILYERKITSEINMKKLLIVDDDALMRYALSTTFHNDTDMDVITASTGQTALKVINENRLDLCFLDVHLPDMNGLDIMMQVRTVSPETRVIIMTGSDVSDSMMKSIQENANCLISKPFELDQVRLFVNRLLSTNKPLYRDERAALVERTPFIKWLADGLRKHKRKLISKSITYYTVRPRSEDVTVLSAADILDISDGGMCIQTACRLDTGHLVRFGDAKMQSEGVVRWSECCGTTNLFRTGIEFVSQASVVF